MPGGLARVGGRAGGAQVGRDGRAAARATPGAGQQRLGRLQVQGPQAQPADVRPQRVAHQVVGEGVTARPGRTRLDEEPRRDALVQDLRDLVLGQPHDLGEQRHVDLRAEHGRDGQDLPGPVGQRGQPVAQHVADSDRDLPGAGLDRPCTVASTLATSVA